MVRGEGDFHCNLYLGNEILQDTDRTLPCPHFLGTVPTDMALDACYQWDSGIPLDIFHRLYSRFPES